jgi:hypothetical protein
MAIAFLAGGVVVTFFFGAGGGGVGTSLGLRFLKMFILSKKLRFPSAANKG